MLEIIRETVSWDFQERGYRDAIFSQALNTSPQICSRPSPQMGAVILRKNRDVHGAAAYAGQVETAIGDS